MVPAEWKDYELVSQWIYYFQTLGNETLIITDYEHTKFFRFAMFLIKLWLKDDIYLRLHLHEIICVQICLGSDPLWYGYNLFAQGWFKLEQYGSIWDHLHTYNWTHLVPIHTGSTRSYVFEHKAYPYQFHT